MVIEHVTLQLVLARLHLRKEVRPTKWKGAGGISSLSELRI